MAEDGGQVITLFLSYLCKCFIISNLDARGLEPLFPTLRPARSRKGFVRENLERVSRRGNAWMALDVISFVIRWPAFGNTRNLSGERLYRIFSEASLPVGWTLIQYPCRILGPESTPSPGVQVLVKDRSHHLEQCALNYPIPKSGRHS